MNDAVANPSGHHGEEPGRDQKKLSRVERKRREARARIVAAAETLMQSRPLDELTIAEITDAADVGHGTFYLHFKSKHDVVVPIIHQHTLQWDEAIQTGVRGMDDPAEAVAYSGRHMTRLILSDPLWRWFLKHSGVPTEDVQNAIGPFAARDFQKGLDTGRFQLPRPALATSYLFGGIVNAILALFDIEDAEDAIDDVLEMLLRGLGLSVEEAREISHKPLAPLAASG